MLAFGGCVWNSAQWNWFIVTIELLLCMRGTLGLPITSPAGVNKEHHESIENLDLRLLDYHLSEDKLGDDLLLEFRSDNLTGIVRLNRVDDSESGPKSSHQQKHGKDEEQEEPYDQKGAMYFAVSVVSLYGLSIGVLVAFSLRRDWDEDEVKHFQRSWVKMDHMMEKQEKQRAKKLMTKAIIAIHQPTKNSLVTATSQAVYMALAPAIPFSDAMNHGADHHGGRLWANTNLPILPVLGTIAEGSACAASSSGPTESSSPAVSAMTLDEGPVRSPPASRSDDGDLDDEEEEEFGEDETTGAEGSKISEDETGSLEDIEKILQEGQLEGQLSLDMPDGDFDMDLSGAGGGTNGKVRQGDGSPLVSKERPSKERSVSPDGSDEVFLRPQAPEVMRQTDANKTPLRTLLGLLSPSLPFMDDEVGAQGSSDDQQKVWSSLTGHRSTQV